MTATAESTIAAPSGSPLPSGPVVLGTDFGPVSARAEGVAIELARESGLPLVIVNAIDPGRLRLPGGRFLQRVDQVRAVRQRLADALLERARSRGVEALVLIWDGQPAVCITDAAAAESASTIVIGSHGRGRLGRAIAGSVSEAVRAAAPCPVHVVQPDEAREALRAQQPHGLTEPR
jgi:nucleotide-binding universal stress UspA family protein